MSTPRPESEAGPFDSAGLVRRLVALVPGFPNARFAVALSGGLDSVSLLAALHEQQHSGGRIPAAFRIRAIHVDHGLQAQSVEWARFCRRLCRSLRVPLSVRRVSVPRRAGLSIEAAAREARYAALARGLQDDETLLTAHHLDDQLETFLLQLMRGAGVSGLAGIAAATRLGQGRMVRPLLPWRREALETWTRERGLSWVDDASNLNTRFDRNYLRHVVLPPLLARWPAAPRVVARSASHLAESRELLEVLASADLAQVALGGVLRLEPLQRLSAARRRNAVRAWLARAGLPTPDSVHLQRIIEELPAARADANPAVVWRGAIVRRFRGALYCAAHPGAPPPVAAIEWDWHRRRTLFLGPGLGWLRLRADPRGTIERAVLPNRLQVRFRGRGEQVRMPGRSQRRTVKELLRAGGVLPWMRDRVPLLFAGTLCVAIGGLAPPSDSAKRVSSPGRYRLDWNEGPRVLAITE